MDWFRRNWPDLLIGIALVAVIAGIIATLITGGSFFPVGQGTRTTTTPPAQSSTATPPSSSTASNPSDNGGAGSAAGGAATTGTLPAGSAAPANGADNGVAAGGSSSGIAVLPPGEAGGAASSTPATSTTPATTGAPAAAGTPAAGGASTTSAVAAPAATTSSGPGSDAPFRISVGAFSNPDNAQSQAETFRQAGYPVFTAPQGDLTIVLVGPYATQGEADTAAARIRQANFGVDPVIYRFRGESDSAPAAASSAAPVPSTPASTSSAAPSTPASVVPATSANGRYLQAGAYGTSESAKPQRDRLEALGFRVTERSEGGLVKLLIGPFDAQQLQQAKGQLDAAGIESFAR